MGLDLLAGGGCAGGLDVVVQFVVYVIGAAIGLGLLTGVVAIFLLIHKGIDYLLSSPPPKLKIKVTPR